MMDILDKLLVNCVPKKNQKLISDLIANEKFHYIEPQHKRVFLDKIMTLGIPYANRFEEGEFRKRVQFMYGGKLRKVKIYAWEL